jgi:predicted molibdopterin-dependent oxidoreductase YjgC
MQANADEKRPELDLDCFFFDGTPIPFVPGQSVASALLAAGIKHWRVTRRTGAPRGLFCGVGVCYGCLIVIDGRPGLRACTSEATGGLQVETQRGPGPW